MDNASITWQFLECKENSNFKNFLGTDRGQTDIATYTLNRLRGRISEINFERKSERVVIKELK